MLYSNATKDLWKTACSGKRKFLIILAIWVFGILIYLPAIHESEVEFGSGKGREKGYICYPNETETKAVVWFTETQYIVSLGNDVVIFSIMAISYLTIWWTFKKALRNKNEILGNDELARLRVNIKGNILEKRMIFTIGIICAYYVLLRFPIFFYGRTPIDRITFEVGLCLLLYKMQFCLHFLAYAIIHESYRQAYLDIFKILLPCCFKKKERDNSSTQEGATKKSSLKLKIPEGVRFSVENQLDIN